MPQARWMTSEACGSGIGSRQGDFDLMARARAHTHTHTHTHGIGILGYGILGPVKFTADIYANVNCC